MKVAVVGNHANIGYLMAKYLRCRGVSATLFVHHRELRVHNPTWEDPELSVNGLPNWISLFGVNPMGVNLTSRCVRYVKLSIPERVSRISLLLRLHDYDLIHIVNGATISGPILRWFRYLCRKPYIITATGSDLRETAFEESWIGSSTRSTLREADKVLLTNMDHLSLARKLGLRSTGFYFYPVDFSLLRKYKPKARDRTQLTVLHPTRLDWSYRGDCRALSGLKRNDMFFQGLAEYVHNVSSEIVAITVERGPDIAKTKELVNSLGISSHVKFIPPFANRRQYIESLYHADIVVDQFKLGSLGLIAVDALACGKPLITYLKSDYVTEIFPESPPVLNVHSEEQLVTALTEISIPENRKILSERISEWVKQYYDWEKVADGLIELYSQYVS